MYIYHKTYHKSSHICECENRSLLLKGCQRGQKSVLTELDWANPRQSSETAEEPTRLQQVARPCEPIVFEPETRYKFSRARSRDLS